MADLGRRLPFAGIAKAIDCVTATKGWSRPKIALHDWWRERRLSDRKAAVLRRALTAKDLTLSFAAHPMTCVHQEGSLDQDSVLAVEVFRE